MSFHEKELAVLQNLLHVSTELIASLIIVSHSAMINYFWLPCVCLNFHIDSSSDYHFPAQSQC